MCWFALWSRVRNVRHEEGRGHATQRHCDNVQDVARINKLQFQLVYVSLHSMPNSKEPFAQHLHSLLKFRFEDGRSLR